MEQNKDNSKWMTDLVVKAQRGDEHAYEQLYKTYSPILISIALRKIQDKVIAEEVAIEAVENAFLKLRSLKEPHAFIGWMKVVVKNEVSDWLRKNKKKSDNKITFIHNNSRDCNEMRPEQLAMDNEMEILLMKKIESLSSPKREIVLFYDIQRKTYAEIKNRIPELKKYTDQYLRRLKQLAWEDLRKMLNERS
jgi:RNA polymerase sigma factor (sigma-70 family)